MVAINNKKSIKEITGRVWLFPDNIDTDLIVPGQYLDAPIREIARHVLEGIRPEFAKNVSNNDIIVAGRNFGCGSSRENAASSLLELGIGCVVAESFGRIFFRNAISIGLPVLTCKDVSRHFTDGDFATVRLNDAMILNLTNNTKVYGESLSAEMTDILERGGILECLKARKEANL